MQKTFFLVLVLCGSLFLHACASSNAYLANRGRDAADIFSANIGAGLGGVKARVGFLQTGLYSEGPGLSFYGPTVFRSPKVGLRGGDWIDGDTLMREFAGWDSNVDIQFVIYGIESFCGGDAAAERGKTRVALTALLFSLPLAEDLFYRTKQPKDPNYRVSKFSPWPYFFDIEVAVGLGYIARFGFNVGELFDFLLGLTTVDIFSDDIR